MPLHDYIHVCHRQTLDVIHTSFPRPLTPYLKDFLTASLNHFQALYPTFAQFYLSSSEPAPHSSEDEPVELPQLLCPILDFVTAVSRGGKAREWFVGGNLTALISSVFNFVQMTDEDVSRRSISMFMNLHIRFSKEETWATNANAFVAQEDDVTQTYSVRVAGFDLLSVQTPSFSIPQAYDDFLQGLLDRKPADTTRSFQSVVQQVVHSSQQAREGGTQDW